jgi:hypothetical protein
MPDIRPVTHADLPAVVELLQDRFPGGVAGEEQLASMMLDHPWADEEITPLVSVNGEGKILGFIGIQVRRLIFDGRPIRGVVATHLAATEDAGPAGALLIRRVLSGPQELSWSDGATDGVVRIWRAFGGSQDYVRLCDFLFVLRPGRWIRGTLAAALQRSLSREDLPVLGFPFQAAGDRITQRIAGRQTGRAFPELDPEVSSADADTAMVIEHLPEMAGGLRLRVNHDQAYLDHTIALVERFTEPMVRRLVRRGDQPIGWYAYQRGRRQVSHVMHLLAAEGEAGAVLGELLAHAKANGSAVVAGRAEPHLVEHLSRRYPILGLARQPVIHATDRELAQVMTTDASLLTRLDGEVFLP